MINNQRVGKAIRTLRIKAGFTQKELAEKIYVSDMAVSKWENGKSVPDITTLKRLSQVLDIDVDGLLDGTASFLDDQWKGILHWPEKQEFSPDTIIWDKPLMDYVFSNFLLAGIRKIMVVSTQKNREIINRRYRWGKLLGIEIVFLDINDKDVMRKIVEEKKEYTNCGIMLIREPVLIYGVNLTRFFQRGMQRKSLVTNLMNVKGTGIGRIENETKKCRHAVGRYQYEETPVYFLDLQRLRNGEDKTDLLNKVFHKEAELQNIYPEPLDKGFICISLSKENSIRNASDLVRIIQEENECLVDCLPEIAWRRGMIETEKFQESVRFFPEYVEYVQLITGK